MRGASHKAQALTLADVKAWGVAIFFCAAVLNHAQIYVMALFQAVSVQAVSKHLKVLEDSGLVSRSRDAQRRPVHLEDNVFDLMTKWIERYQRQAEERYQRLDAVLDAMTADEDGEDANPGTASAS